jgi:DGQHR domain-containing protein
MPTAILLSGRGMNVQVSQNGTITLSEETKLPLIDGQHRTRGFEYAFRDKGLTQFADYEIPVVIMPDVDKVGEMRQFSVVNGTQKSVRTDLVNMILAQLSEVEGEDAIKATDHWKVVVSKVVTALNNDKSGPWFDRIVMPDQKTYSADEIAANPELANRRVIRATSFMTSLKPIDAYLHEHGFADGDGLDARVRSLLSVVDAFWRAIRRLNPTPFAKSAEFVLQKTPGIFALHQLCLRVMKDMHIGHRKWTEDQFAEVLSNCAELADPSYWHIGTGEGDGGDAARYGSMKGFSELASLLYQSLRS